MDVTMASTQTHNWELLAQLALCGQSDALYLDSLPFAAHVVDVLQQHLPFSWGVLVAMDHQHVYASASWGLSDSVRNEKVQEVEHGRGYNSYPLACLPLPAGADRVGYLLLSDDGRNDTPHAFYEAVAAQLGMLLVTHRRVGWHDVQAPALDHCPPDNNTEGGGVHALTTPQGKPHPPDPADDIHVLQRVSRLAASTHNEDTMYQEVLETLVDLIGADRASMIVYNRKKGIGPIVAAYGMEETARTIPYSLVENPAILWLDTHQRPLVSTNVFNEPLLTSFYDTFQLYGVQSMVLLPMSIAGQVLGCIELDFVKQPDVISSSQLETAQAIAYQIARVVENARLFQESQSHAQALHVKVGELSTLLEAARLLGSLLQPDQVLNNLMELVRRQLGVTTVALWTLDSKRSFLHPEAMYGIPREEAEKMQVPVGEGLTGKIAGTGLPLIIEDVEEHSGSLYPTFNQRNRLVSFMGVPVFYRERIIGVLSVMTNEPRKFSTDEMMLMIGLAGQAAIALENAWLFQDRERRISQLTSMNEIGTAVNTTLDLEETLLVLHRGISDVLDTQYSFIGLYDVKATGEMPVLLQRAVRDGETDQARVSEQSMTLDGKGLVDHILLEARPLLFHTAEEIAAFLAKQSAEHVSCGLSVVPQSWLGVPILLGDDVLGIINLQSATPLAYSEDDMHFLTTVASQAGAAISNARLFTEHERRLREITVLKDIGTALSSTLDLPMVLGRLYHELEQAIDMRTSFIGLYDEATNQISYPVCYEQGDLVEIAPAPLDEDTPGGWAIRNRQPLLLHTAEQCANMGLSGFGRSVFDVRSGQSGIRHPRSRPMQSFLVVPIATTDTVLGVINVNSHRPYAFDQDDLRFLTTVTNQLAVTISNIDLFSDRERRIEELATFNEIGQELSASVRYGEPSELIYRQTGRLLDTNGFYMALYDEISKEITFPLFYEHGRRQRMDLSSAYRGEVDSSGIEAVNPSLHMLITYLTRRVIDRRSALVLQGNELEQEEWDVALREELGNRAMYDQRPRSWVGVPMVVADTVVGVIGLQNYESNQAYSDSDVRLLSTIAAWAGIALDNARMFEQISTFASNLEHRVAERTTELEEANIQLRQEKDSLETVHAITLQLTSTLNLEEIIGASLKVTSQKLGVARGSIMLRELESGQLICRAVLQEQGIVQSTDFPISFRGSEGLVGWVMQNQEPVRIPDVLQDTRWVVEAGRADEVRSIVAVPLKTSDSTLGVLILSSPDVDYFTESQLRLLATIGNEIAIATNNAQLYSYLNEVASKLSDLLQLQKEETSRSQAILESLTEGVIVLDEDRNIELFNVAADHMLGIPARAVLNQPMETLAEQGEADQQRRRARTLHTNLEKGLAQVAEQHITYSMSFELPWLPNPQTITMNIAPVVGLDSLNYGTVAVLRDITREIESDRAKREFISKVSHELRTPLTSVKGYVDLLLLGSSGDLSVDQVGYLNVIKTNAHRLMELINDFLDMSRIESGRIKLTMGQVDLRDVLEDVLKSLKLEADAKGLNVSVDIAESLPVFTADGKRLTQIIFNLFSNAVKYTYDRGNISIRAFLNPAGMVQVEVEDTGVGMSPEQQDQLFRPFYRADNPLREQVGGTGLGLAISKSLVEQHNGEMWVTSEEGSGSTFRVILPLEQPEAGDELDEGSE